MTWLVTLDIITIAISRRLFLLSLLPSSHSFSLFALRSCLFSLPTSLFPLFSFLFPPPSSLLPLPTSFVAFVELPTPPPSIIQCQRRGSHSSIRSCLHRPGRHHRALQGAPSLQARGIGTAIIRCSSAMAPLTSHYRIWDLRGQDLGQRAEREERARR